MSKPVRVLYIYAEADAPLRRALEEQLAVFRRQGQIEEWGADWLLAGAAIQPEVARMLDWEGIAAFVAHWESLPLFATERDASAEERARLHAVRLANDPHGLAASLRGAGQGAMAPLHDALPGITAPTLVLAGALDETGLPRARSVGAMMAMASC